MIHLPNVAILFFFISFENRTRSVCVARGSTTVVSLPYTCNPRSARVLRKGLASSAGWRAAMDDDEEEEDLLTFSLSLPIPSPPLSLPLFFRSGKCHDHLLQYHQVHPVGAWRYKRREVLGQGGEVLLPEAGTTVAEAGKEPTRLDTSLYHVVTHPASSSPHPLWTRVRAGASCVAVIVACLNIATREVLGGKGDKTQTLCRSSRLLSSSGRGVVCHPLAPGRAVGPCDNDPAGYFSVLFIFQDRMCRWTWLGQRLRFSFSSLLSSRGVSASAGSIGLFKKVISCLNLRSRKKNVFFF